MTVEKIQETDWFSEKWTWRVPTGWLIDKFDRKKWSCGEGGFAPPDEALTVQQSLISPLSASVQSLSSVLVISDASHLFFQRMTNDKFFAEPVTVGKRNAGGNTETAFPWSVAAFKS